MPKTPAETLEAEHQKTNEELLVLIRGILDRKCICFDGTKQETNAAVKLDDIQELVTGSRY